MKTCFFSMLILCTLILVQGCAPTSRPTMAVYVTGDLESKRKSDMRDLISNDFVNSHKYDIVERGQEFLEELQKEQLKQRSGSVDEGQISELGKQSGVQFVCVTKVTEFNDSTKTIYIQLINVETAKVIASDIAHKKLENPEEFKAVSKKIVDNILKTKVSIASKKTKNTENTENKAKDNVETKPENKVESKTETKTESKMENKIEENKQKNIPERRYDNYNSYNRHYYDDDY